MSKKKIIAISCAVVIVAGLGGLGFMQIQFNDATANAQPVLVSQVLVQAQNPVRGELTQTAEFLGEVEPNELVTVLPKVSGTVLKTYFEVGDTVKKGDLLYEIDPSDIELSLSAAEAQAEAGRIQAEVGLGSGYDAKIIDAKSGLDAAQKAYNTARANLRDYTDDNGNATQMAEKEMNRLEATMKNLQDELDKMLPSDSDYADKQKAVTKAEEDYRVARANFNELDNDDSPQGRELRTAFSNAQISYNAAKDAYDLVVGQARSDTELTTDADLRAAEAGLAAQRKQLEYTKVYAPIGGVIEQKAVSEHGLTDVSSPAYTVSNKSLMLVKFGVSENAAQSIAVGDKVTIEKGGELLDGTITEVATMVDAQTGLFHIKAMVDNPEVPLHTGTMIKVIAQINKESGGVLIPVDGVYYEDGAPYVYLFRDGVARRTPVETGISNAEQIVVTGGLSPDDQVITSWHPKLLDGATVALEFSASSASAASSAPAASVAESAASAQQ